MNRWQDFLGELLDVGIDRAVAILLALVALYPGCLALLYLVAPSAPQVRLNVLDLLWLSDAGGQMGMGPGLLRGLTVLAGALWFIKLRDLPRGTQPGLGLAGLFYALALLSALTSSHPHDALLGWVDLLDVGLLVVISADLGARWPRLLERVPYAAILLTLVVIPANYKQFLFEPAADEQMRGAFFHPNIMASYLILLLPLLLAAYLRDEPRFAPGATLLFGIAAAFSLGSIVLSFSRAGQLVGIATVLATLALHPSQGGPRLLRRLGLTAGLGALAAILLWRGFAGNTGWVVLAVALLLGLSAVLLRAWSSPRLALGRFVLLLGLVAVMLTGMDLGQGKVSQHAATRAQNLAAGTDNSFLARLAFWKAAWEIALDHPTRGVGPAGFQRYYPSYQVDLNWFSKFAHNLPLTILAETGFPAFTVLLGVSALVAWSLERRLREFPAGPRRDSLVGLVVGVGAFLVYCCSDVQWEFRALPLAMAMLLGLALGSPARADAPPEPEALGEEPPLSAWTIRPQVLLQHSLCVGLLAVLFLNFVVALGEERARFGKAATELSKPKEAAIFYREALVVDPWQGEHFRQACLSMLSAGGTDEKTRKEILALAERVVQLDAHRAVGFNLLGRVYLQAGQAERARESFRRALELDPINYPSFYIDLANEYLNRGQNEQARLLLLATIQRFPQESFAAMFDFRARSIRTQLSDAHLLLGDMSNPVQNPRLAQGYFERAVALNDKSRLAWFGLAVALHHQGRDAEASRPLTNLLKLEPTYAPGLRLGIEIQRALGNSAEAEALQKRLDEAEPKPQPGAR